MRIAPSTEPEWKLVRENCTGCGICADVCSYEAIEMSRDMAYPEPVPGACTGCEECLQECPFDAIVVILEDAGSTECASPPGN